MNFDKLKAALSEQVCALVGGSGSDILSASVDLAMPSKGFHFGMAAGKARPDMPMSKATPVHWASIGKTVTAILVLKAEEAGLLGVAGIDASLRELSIFDDAVLRRLHNGAGYGRRPELTIRHLLTHTAGLRDGMIDDRGLRASENKGVPAPHSLLGGLLFADGDAGRKRHWKPWNPDRLNEASAGTLNHYLCQGLGEAPIGLPGDQFSYSDTGYVCLGVLLETVFDASLATLAQRLVFSPLGITDAYLAYRNDPSLGVARRPEADVYLGDLALLESGFSLSFDWGGGGWVSSVSSLNRVLTGLIDGELVSQSSLLKMTDWQTPTGLQMPRLGVGLGLFRTQGPCGALIGHSGAWGAKVFRVEGCDLTFSGSVNQAMAPADWHWPLIELAYQNLGRDGSLSACKA